MRTKRKPIIPDWLSDMPGTTLINTKEMKDIFSYKSSDCVISASIRGIIPPPDSTLRVPCSKSKVNFVKKNYWKLSTIREFIKNND